MKRSHGQDAKREEYQQHRRLRDDKWRLGLRRCQRAERRYFQELGHVFAANMTGNVVFLGFGVADAQDFSVLASLAALGAFLLGAVVGGKLGASQVIIGAAFSPSPPTSRSASSARRSSMQ